MEERLFRTRIQSPVGELELVATPNALVEVALGKARSELAEEGGNAVLEQAADELAAYFAGELETFHVPTAPQGTEFYHRVWALLTEVPYGETRTYGELARTLEMRNGARAVGAANSKNPLMIVVPCHRIVGADGALTGYAGGISTKRWLLKHEGALGQQALF